jgi:hypothetical protein
VVVFSGLQTLVNFNPLIKLDGYYMLSDFLEVPNLRGKALRSLWDWIAGNGKVLMVRPRDARAACLRRCIGGIFHISVSVRVFLSVYLGHFEGMR